MLALTLIKGEKVNLWVRNMIAILQRLHLVHHNVPAVWNHFKEEFKTKFMDSTRELWARTQLERLGFKYPDINGYIAEFKDLITQVNYNLASQEVINLFLKGIQQEPKPTWQSIHPTSPHHLWHHEKVTHSHCQIDATGQFDSAERTRLQDLPQQPAVATTTGKPAN
jgi:hypothetical protein